MRGAHVSGAPRTRWRRSGGRGATGVGWWQPPPGGRRRVLDADQEARHRRPDADEPIPPAPAPARRPYGLRRIAALGATVAVLGPLAALTPGLLLVPAPTPDDLLRHTSALLTYTDGTELTRLAALPADRLDEVPAPVREAVLAVQDPEFDTRFRLDPTGPLPGALADRALAGYAAGPGRAYRRTVLVAGLALRDPERQLADHLAVVPLGRGAYGVVRGAAEYFGKRVEELTVEEAAVLAGLIDAPAEADPAIDPAGAEQRWQQVLDAMVAQGRLDPTRRAAARYPVVLPRRPDAGLPAGDRAPVVAAVLAELDRLGFDEAALTRGGLRVTTTLDPDRQATAGQAAAAVRAEDPAAGVGVVTVDPGTGGVLVYQGGPQAATFDATRTPYLAGSALDPFVLLAGQLQDTPVPADAGWPDAEQIGTLTRRIGPGAVGDVAAAAGISALAGPDHRSPTTTPVDAFTLAGAYATLAADGVRRPVHLVASVSTTDGRLLFRASTTGDQRFPAEAVRSAARVGPPPAQPGEPWAAGIGAGAATVVQVSRPMVAADIAGDGSEVPDAVPAPVDPGAAARQVWDLVTG